MTIPVREWAFVIKFPLPAWSKSFFNFIRDGKLIVLIPYAIVNRVLIFEMMTRYELTFICCLLF